MSPVCIRLLVATCFLVNGSLPLQCGSGGTKNLPSAQSHDAGVMRYVGVEAAVVTAPLYMTLRACKGDHEMHETHLRVIANVVQLRDKGALADASYACERAKRRLTLLASNPHKAHRLMCCSRADCITAVVTAAFVVHAGCCSRTCAVLSCVVVLLRCHCRRSNRDARTVQKEEETNPNGRLMQDGRIDHQRAQRQHSGSHRRRL